MAIPDDQDEWLADLAKLREPFPPERIEKLPKPMWKGAWDGETKGQCPECGGYHVRVNTIHLDYVGHANCTDRLLEVDPCWDWEPLAFNADGLPLFDRAGGLWIKLTICGVTRLGYGDGNSPKEIIGDAIRNAAMRFGVALDLWAKINLHEERNPGDGPTSSSAANRATGGSSDGPVGRSGGGTDGRQDQGRSTSQPPNQEALEELGSICDQHGYDRRSCGGMYAEWASQQDHPGTPRLIDAEPDAIRLFGAYLIVMASPDVQGDGEGPGVPADTSGDAPHDAEADSPEQSGERGPAQDAAAGESLPTDTGTEAAAGADGSNTGTDGEAQDMF